jgi:tryptophan synthase alpha chain
MSRIADLFSRKKKDIVSVYFTSGFPQLNDTVEIIRTLSEEGVDMIEIGIPYSDPMADGPVIQRSSQIALDNGISQKVLFEQLKDIRKETNIPLLFMGYLNTAMQYGFENLCRKAVEIGVDGMIIPDIPLDIYEKDFKPIVDKYGLDFILLITPETSEERIRHIDRVSTGFVYMVSSAATTGSQKVFDDEKLAYFKKIAEMNLKNPLLVGFGVSNKETFDAASKYTNGAIIGSAFIRLLDEKKSIREAVKALLESIRN